MVSRADKLTEPVNETDILQLVNTKREFKEIAVQQPGNKFIQSKYKDGESCLLAVEVALPATGFPGNG